MKLPRKDIVQFQGYILDWFSQNKRDLPWRRTRNPYRIMVSEIMLQQTQVGRVIPKYETWLDHFPTLESLAGAKTREVLRLWSGLGYNRRALFLQKTAQQITTHDKGKWPKDTQELEKLPGIGRYTAGAIACFAFDKQIAVVDTNIRKVILLQFGKYVTNDSLKNIQQIADALLPHGRAYEWNQALMDYTAVVLKKEKVPIARQSKFHGSNRYYRGKVLLLLLERQKLSSVELYGAIRDSYMPSDALWFEGILGGMLEDGLIIKKGKNISLP